MELKNEEATSPVDADYVDSSVAYCSYSSSSLSFVSLFVD